MSIDYLDKEDIENAFKLVQNQFDREDERNPKYQEQPQAIENLEALLERVKNNKFYPTFEEKASALFINIIKGHFFFDGNKRLGIVITIIFLIKNGKFPDNLSKEDYKNKLSNLFPDEKFEDDESFDPLSFSFYNLAIITASHQEKNIEFEKLENKIKQFLYFITTEEKNTLIGFIQNITSWFGVF